MTAQREGLTSLKLIRILTNHPMPTLHIRQLKSWKEPPDDGQSLIRHVVTLGSSDHQRRPLESILIGINVREIAHLVEIGGQVVQWHAPVELRLAVFAFCTG